MRWRIFLKEMESNRRHNSRAPMTITVTQTGCLTKSLSSLMSSPKLNRSQLKPRCIIVHAQCLDNMVWERSNPDIQSLHYSFTSLTFPVPADRREAVDQMKDSVSCPGRLRPHLQRLGEERIVDTSSTSCACPMWVQSKTGFPLSFRHSMWHWEHLAS